LHFVIHTFRSSASLDWEALYYSLFSDSRQGGDKRASS
jgi:hypothetical protein